MLLTIGVFMLVVLRCWPKPAWSQAWPSSTAIYDQEGRLLRLSLARDEQYRLWVPLERMPPKLVQAVKLYEDQWFDWHPGVNPVALWRAAFNTVSGRHRMGASTLTMQLARRWYGLNTRSVSGKIQQIGYALWLEARYSKRDLLEAYLNMAPYGRNVEGVAAASLVFFHARVEHLSMPQIMALAVVPQNPRARSPGQTLDTAQTSNRSQAGIKARAKLWHRWLAEHPKDHAHSADVLAPLPSFTPADLPFAAPHLSDALLRDAQDDGVAEITTTLNLHAQQVLENLIAQTIQSQAGLGIRNAAALLMDASSGEARAYVGSADYFEASIHGQVNGITAKRSPGSTLKPFIYALALDQGLIHPHSVLRDAPTSFGSFSPENFDGRFTGPLTAQDALVRSRNVPAVSLASQLASPSLYEFLKTAGVSKLKSEKHYGLALALGGAEASVEELASLYASLANRGRHTPLRLIRDTSSSPPKNTQRNRQPTTQLLSEEAAYITLNMLQRTPRPDTQLPATPPVAWKTGTSWGFHDAWTAGVVGHHVLVVWVGNFDNTANPAFVGVQAAAPLFFRITDSLRAQGLIGHHTPLPPSGVRQVEVCTASGDLPNALCPLTSNTLFIPGKSPIRVSTLHRAVWVGAAGRATCGPQPGARQEVFEFWPSELLALFRQAGMPRRTPPPDADCPSSSSRELRATLSGAPDLPGFLVSSADDAPRIVSPLRGAIYTLRVGAKRPTSITLTAHAASRTRKLFWFANQVFLGQSDASQSLLWTPAQAGRYVLRVVDENGASDSRDVVVEFNS